MHLKSTLCAAITGAISLAGIVALPAGAAHATPAHAVAANLIANPGVEVGVGNVPAGWSTDNWGTNTTTFSRTTDAHSGTYAARVSITGWKSGDAKWGYTAVPVVGGAYYTFDDWYKSNVGSEVALAYTLHNGSTSWYNLNLGIAPSPSRWSQFRGGFIMPAGAVTAYFAHILPSNGWLETDDYSMTRRATAPEFKRALISIAMDNASPSEYAALQTAKPYGFKSTLFCLTNRIGTDEWSAATIKALFLAGNEIGGHSVSHPELPTLNAAQLKYQITASKTKLESIVGKGNITDFGSPFGEYNATTIAAIKADGYSSQRSTDEGINTASDLNPWNIHVENMQRTTTLAQFASWVHAAVVGHYYLVVVYHEFLTTAQLAQNLPEDNFWSTSPALWKQQLNVIKASGVKVVTIHNALKELLPQVHLGS